MSGGFADRLAARVEERRSQVCLGLDPDPATFAEAAGREHEASRPGRGEEAGPRAPARAAADAALIACRALIDAAGPACVCAKLQLACFERLGPPGWTALYEVAAAAREAGLLVIADGKRGDVPVSAAAYAQALFGSTPTPWGEVEGLGADAATLNPLLGSDALEPLLETAVASEAGLFILVRTSNPGAGELLDLETPGGPLHERLARLVAGHAGRLAGGSGLSGMGAVVGATEPRHLGRLRELMPSSVFLVPGVGAQGGRASDLSPALGAHPASLLVSASRSIAGAPDPAQAAEELRSELWSMAR